LSVSKKLTVDSLNCVVVVFEFFFSVAGQMTSLLS